LDGEKIKLSDYRGKVVLVDFWATWCGPCIAEMPNVAGALKKHGEEGDFIVLGISLDKDEATVREFLKKHKDVAWAQIVGGPAKENEIAKLYGVEGVPATFLIDPDGKVAAKDLRGAALASRVGELLDDGGDKVSKGDANDDEGE
jgi:thiol-disulfide isomerase/thioredoxin